MTNLRGAARAPLLLFALLGPLLGLGCVSDDDLDNDRAGTMDAGVDAGAVDTGAGKPLDASQRDATAAFTCRSWTEPNAGMCGGAHCNQTFVDLRASAQPGAACGSEVDLLTLCSLRGPEVVGKCVQLTPTDRAATASCAQAQLGENVSAGCLECYLRTAECAIQNCLADCLASSATERCDNCRTSKGCADVFFACAGLEAPPQKP